MGQNYSAYPRHSLPGVTISTPIPTDTPCFLHDPRLKVNISHYQVLGTAMQKYKRRKMLEDRNRAVLFRFLPPELRIQIWKDAFTEWYQSQRIVRLVVPASPLVSGKVICDTLDNIDHPHPNSLSIGSGFPTKVCPLLNANFEARQIALRQFAGLLDICSCWQHQCYQCQSMGIDTAYLGHNKCACRDQCRRTCHGKAYFTADQIFYIAGFNDIISQANKFENDISLQRTYNIDENNHPLAWASKLQNVALNARQLRSLDAETIRTTLSKFTSLKKLYIVWNLSFNDGLFTLALHLAVNSDGEVIFSHETQLQCVKRYFESPELWFDQLPGVETELIFLPMDPVEDFHGITSSTPSSSANVNRLVRALEDCLTPVNDDQSADIETSSCEASSEVSFTIQEQWIREREEFRQRQRRIMLQGRRKRAEFLTKHGLIGECNFRARM
jgi:hypothetical protein